MKVQRNNLLRRHGPHVAVFKTLNFMVLFCFTSSDQSEMVDWLMADCKGSFNKTSCIEYTWLKIVTKTFLEKMQHKMQYVNAQEIWCTFVLHF